MAGFIYRCRRLALLASLLLLAVPLSAQPDQHLEGMEEAALTRDGQWILTSSGERGDSMVGVWEAATGKLVRKLEGLSQGAYSLATTPQSDKVVCVGGDDTIRMWEIATGNCLLTITGATPRTGLTLVPTGRYIVTDDGHYGLKFLTTARGELGMSLPGLAGQDGSILWTVRVSPDSAYALAGYYSGRIRVWDLTQNKWVRDLQLDPCRIWDLAVTPDGRWLISGADEGARIWDLRTGQCRYRLVQDDVVSAVTLTPDGQRVLVASTTEIALFDLATGQKARTCAQGAFSIWGFTPDCRQAAHAGRDGVRIVAVDLGPPPPDAPAGD